MFKRCSSCDLEKSIELFYKKERFRRYPTSLAGYDNHCKECVKLDRKKVLENNPEAKKRADRKQHLKRYNLTIDQYNQLFIKQNGCCFGCKIHQNEFNRNFVVDHCHKTNKVRGLLCIGCNLILGYAQDNTKILMNLIEYLKLNNSASAEKTDNTNNVVSIKRSC